MYDEHIVANTNSALSRLHPNAYPFTTFCRHLADGLRFGYISAAGTLYMLVLVCWGDKKLDLTRGMDIGELSILCNELRHPTGKNL